MNFIEHFKVDGKRNFAERVTLWEYAYIPYYIDPTCKYTCKYECVGSPKTKKHGVQYVNVYPATNVSFEVNVKSWMII